MDFQKGFIYVALAIIAFLLYSHWQQEHVIGTQAVVESQAVPVTPNTNVPSLSTVSKAKLAATSVPSVQRTSKAVEKAVEASGEKVTVKTDVLSVTIDTMGGKILQANLNKYPKKYFKKTPISLFGIKLFTWKVATYNHEATELLNDNPGTLYIAESGLTGEGGPDTPDHLATYQVEKLDYVLADDQDSIDVVMHWRNEDGVKIDKKFTFERGDYSVKVSYTVENQSVKPWEGNLYALINRTEVPQEVPGLFHLSTYMGAAISTPNKHYQKVSFKDMAKDPLSLNAGLGWISMIQHYFISAWAPKDEGTYHYYSVDNGDDQYTIGLVGPSLSVAGGATKVSELVFYAGPTTTQQLSQVAPHLDLTVDYGWLWWLSEPIFWVMKHIHDLIGNWGFAIIFVTIIIKLIFYPLSSLSYRSMAAMRTLQPKMQALKERYGDDKQKISQATMELYRKEKVNPLSGCLPILVQIPFFIALYYVLMESVELRQAPFIFWIHDLSTRDPYFILPILMGASMFLQQRLSPTPPDPTQAKVMMFLPIIFTGMFLFFPSGLVLYWLTNNILSISQQWYITRSYEAGKGKPKNKKKK